MVKMDGKKAEQRATDAMDEQTLSSICFVTLTITQRCTAYQIFNQGPIIHLKLIAKTVVLMKEMHSRMRTQSCYKLGLTRCIIVRIYKHRSRK